MGSLNLEGLLYEQESDVLDFKRDSYEFIGATDDKKSEILKDILAFANAWRRTDAIILTGVEEVKGKKHKVVGILDGLDDASLQQFVNSKTQRPVSFEYCSEMLGEFKVGVLIIPVQQRPVYLNRDYGRLKRNVVYIRRGTSTNEASPDEIREMALSDNAIESRIPALSIAFADIKNRMALGSELCFDGIFLNVPNQKDIPDCENNDRDFREVMRYVNQDYYRELVYWHYIHKLHKSFGFMVTNSSAHVAQDVRVEIVVDKEAGDFSFFPAAKLPKYPRRYSSVMDDIRPLSQQMREIRETPDVTIAQTSGKWLINIALEKVRPRQVIFTDVSIAIAAKNNDVLVCRAQIYADNLPAPIEQELVIKPNISDRPGDLELIKKLDIDRTVDLLKRRGRI